MEMEPRRGHRHHRRSEGRWSGEVCAATLRREDLFLYLATSNSPRGQGLQIDAICEARSDKGVRPIAERLFLEFQLCNVFFLPSILTPPTLNAI